MLNRTTFCKFWQTPERARPRLMSGLALAPLAALALAACASGTPETRPPPTPQEQRANQAPHDMCVDQCFRSSGSSGTKSDRDFCEERCTW